MSVNSFDDYPMSWRPELDSTSKPLYLQLAKRLESDIQCGLLLPGTRLPPQRELADFLGINLSTVSRAFRLCSDMGLLTGSVGNGTYVSYSAITKLTEQPDRDMIRLDSMTPESIEQHEISLLLKKMLDEPDFSDKLQYRLSMQPWQFEAARRLLLRAGCHAGTDAVLTAGGGQNAIAAVLAALLKRGDRLGVDPLTYPGIKSAAKLLGIQLVPIEQENGHMSQNGILGAVKNDGVRAIFVMPDYQNPTSHIMSTEAREMIAHTARKCGLIIIEDGICKLLSSAPPSVHDYAPESTVFMLSLSKTLSPALKTAYIATPERFRAAIDDALYSINLSQSALLTELAARLIASDKYESLLRRRAEGIEKRNKLVDIILSDHTVRGDGYSLSRWLVLPDGMTGAQFETEAAARGVSVYGAEHFAIGKSIPEAGARLAVCSPESLDELERALYIIKDILK